MSNLLANNTKEEYVLCAAIYIDDGKLHPSQPNNIQTGFVISGRRHHNCFHTLTALGIKHTSFGVKIIQGFLTSKDKFLERKDALILAIEQKQCDPKRTSMLFSEDLY